MRLLIKILNICVLMATVAWLAKSPGLESASATLAAFAALIAQEVAQSRPKYRKADLALFKEFLSRLPSNSREFEFLSKQDIGGLLEEEPTAGLRGFEAEWDNAEHKFLDKHLEAKRREFYDLLRDFLGQLGRYSWPWDENPRLYTIGLHEREEKDETEATRKALNAIASRTAKAHQELVACGRRIFGDAPL
jgi:hypothetical protein